MANLSSVITQTVGNSTAGVNLITSPNSGSIWTASTITASTTTTAAELPLGPAIGTATKFALSASPGSAYVDFDVPSSLLSTKLGMGWFARASSSFTASITLSLSSYSSTSNRTSNTSPTTVTLQTSSVQGTATQFYTTFDSHGTNQYYRLTMSFTGLAAAWYSICQMQVGPGQMVQGAAVSEWQSFSLATALTNEGTISNSQAFYRRVGSDMEISFSTQMSSNPGGALLFGPPVGTIDSSKLNAVSGTVQVVGTWNAYDNAGANYTGAVTFEPGVSTTILLFRSSSALVNSGVPFSWGASDILSAQIRIPIAEWAGSGTVNLGPGAQVEYAATSGTWDADSTTTVYGPTGQAMGGALTALRNKTVTWQYPLQSDDVVILEASKDQLTWTPLTSSRLGASGNAVIPGISADGATVAGAYIDNQSSTQTRITFGRYLNMANDDAPTADWPSSQAYWRVRKVKASSPVGFGLAGTDGSAGLYKAGQAPGYVGGAAIPANYVGEYYDTGSSTFFTTTPANILSRTLQPGVWRIAAYTYVNSGAGPTWVQVSISSSSATHDTYNRAWSIVSSGVSSVSTETLVNIAAATTYYLVGSSGTAAVNNAQTTRLICHRIA